MGKWSNRSRFQRRRSPMRWYSERHSYSSSGHYGDDGGIPRWEKRFCEEIGSVPWPKVVEASNFKSWYQGNVITWNDSACEETFNNEKNRFWSQVNGIYCDISLPDPDLYISEVDWDTCVDPELITDLERAYFAPPDDDDVKIGFKRGRRDKYWSGCNLDPVDETQEGNALESSTDCMKDSVRAWEDKPSFGNNMSGDCLTIEEGREIQWKTNNDSWENSGQGNDGWYKSEHQNKPSFGNDTTEQGKEIQWKTNNDSWENSGQVNDGCYKSEHQNKKAKGFESVLAEEYDNPWEAKPSCRKETAIDTSWGDCSGKEGWEDGGWGSGGWGTQDLRNQGRERKEWSNKRYSHDFQQPKDPNPWKAGYGHGNGPFREFGGNAGGWQTHRGSETNQRNWDVQQSNDGWGRRSKERDDLYRYNSNHRNSRPRRDDYQNRKVNF